MDLSDHVPIEPWEQMFAYANRASAPALASTCTTLRQPGWHLQYEHVKAHVLYHPTLGCEQPCHPHSGEGDSKSALITSTGCMRRLPNTASQAMAVLHMAPRLQRLCLIVGSRVHLGQDGARGIAELGKSTSLLKLKIVAGSTNIGYEEVKWLSML